ncbi:MAG: hypothetical protein A3E81_02120 [Gammaproteobacteria bacterium RIFCSPHIGHO2_12_FULL_36_30]|nr:MAG: hypothetical protein A3E81_02120 [Gammaproteobacteria bacterium RIFCSPHIGHO2_12_FULL_36_30]
MNQTLKSLLIDTKLGQMIAIADEKYLYLLEFTDCKKCDREIKNLKNEVRSNIVSGKNIILKKIEKELKNYFSGKDFNFTTPMKLIGSDFQKNVWKTLQKISPGKTQSYLDTAKAIKKPKAFRAVANANGANKLAIIIPCHRVINTDGKMGGYAGGIARKEWLLAHEKK